MTCNEIEDRLPAYLEDLLSPAEKEIIEGHLATCSRCRRAVAGLKKTDELVQNLGDVEPPPFFEQRIMSRIREEAGQKKGILRRLFYPLHIKVPIQALASILIAVLGFYVYHTGEPEMKQMAPLPPSLTESAKGQVTTDSPEPVVSPPFVIQDRRVAVVNTYEKKQQPLVAPPSEDGGKDSRMADSQAPMREEVPSEMKPAATTPKEMEKKASPVGAGASGQQRTGKPEVQRAIDTDLPKQKRKERIAETDAAPPAGESRRTAASPAPSRLMTSVAVKKPTFNLTIRVKDKETGLREIEAFLSHLYARIVEKRKGDEKVHLKAEIDSQDFAAFLDRLETIGRIEKSPFVAPEGKVTVSITIIGNP